MTHAYLINQLYTCAGHLSSIYTPEELDDPVGVAGIVLDEYPLPELMLDEDFNLDNDDGIDGMTFENQVLISMHLIFLFYGKICKTVRFFRFVEALYQVSFVWKINCLERPL